MRLGTGWEQAEKLSVLLFVVGRVAERGDVLEVKVLGLLAMIDDGETDWKMIVIDVNDPQAADLNNLEDVERLMPGFLAATRDWFR